MGENDSPRSWMANLSSGERTMKVTQLLLEGTTVAEMLETYGVTPAECAKVRKMNSIDLRLAEIQESVLTFTLKDKGKLLRKTSAITLHMLSEWAESFYMQGKHREMKVTEAVSLMNLAKGINELRRLEAGKPTNRTEVISRKEKDVDIIETLSSAKAEEGGDPFKDYGTSRSAKESKT